jgi:hypothetical protein
LDAIKFGMKAQNVNELAEISGMRRERQVELDTLY